MFIAIDTGQNKASAQSTSEFTTVSRKTVIRDSDSATKVVF